MPITNEIEEAAANLGRALAASTEMQELEEIRVKPEEPGRVELHIEVVKALFTRTAMRLNTTLGVKFTDFVS